jgi:hypothetical protein
MASSESGLTAPKERKTDILFYLKNYCLKMANNNAGFFAISDVPLKFGHH